MKRIAVVVSQGQSHNPARRKLEEDLVTALILEPGIDVTVVPHLYDLNPDSTGLLALQGVGGDLIVLSWMYSRAAHWLLDRNDIRGRFGTTLLKYGDDEDQVEEDDAAIDESSRVIDQRSMPDRTIYCLDLRASEQPDMFLVEIRRIANEAKTQVVDLMSWVKGSPNGETLKRFQRPTNDTALGTGQSRAPDVSIPETETTAVQRIEDTADRRWYPVIDFSRCTNCMECIDFCLFGVYGVDGQETILVEQPDSCRKGCPACSRVCPENAIIFPQHKTPAIAGAEVALDGLKIDLSKLFGAPENKEDAAQVAARERDEQLLLAGRDAVGMSVGVRKRQADKPPAPKDNLDDLLDQLDDLDL